MHVFLSIFAWIHIIMMHTPVQLDFIPKRVGYGDWKSFQYGSSALSK